jgi:hypothetical protein
MTTHYVDNSKLFEEIKIYRIGVLEFKAGTRKVKPKIPEYIGTCILLIANRLSHKPNFINYSYREEMISDGIENCISYIDNFDPEKSDNPFAYFTQIIYYAFLRRIAKERKQLYIKHKTLENNMLMNILVEQHGSDENEFQLDLQDMDFENMNEFIRSFEQNIDKRKTKRQKGLDQFLEDDNEDSNTG